MKLYRIFYPQKYWRKSLIGRGVKIIKSQRVPCASGRRSPAIKRPVRATALPCRPQARPVHAHADAQLAFNQSHTHAGEEKEGANR